MSSKFSHQSSVQGTPPVCKKPPDEPISPPPPLPDTRPNIFSHTMLAAHTPPFTVSTNFPAYPIDKSIAWLGNSQTFPDLVEIALILNTSTMLLDITVTAKRLDRILNVLTFWGVPLIAPDRLQTRLIEARNPAQFSYHQIQVFQ